MNKRARAASESLAFLAMLSGILVAINILGTFFFTRADLTTQRLFSLSEGSKRAVTRLTDELEVTAYFTKDLPPPFNATERYVRDLLDEYKIASNGRMKVQFINPDSEEMRARAEADGVQKVPHQQIEKDAVSVVEGYRGVVFKYLGESKALPAIEATEGLEYEITQALRSLSGDKIELGVVTDHDGASVTDGLVVLQKLLPSYRLGDVKATAPIPARFKALLIASPVTPFTDQELRNIDAYVMNGGSLGVFGGGLSVKSDPATGSLRGTTVNSGLNTLLEKWGVSIEGGVVADAQCRQVPLRTPFGMAIPTPYPPMPIASLTDAQASHPAAFRLGQVMAPFSSPLKLREADPAIKVTTLASSSKDSWHITGEVIDLKPREGHEWQSTITEQHGPFVLAVALEGKLPSAFAAEAVSSAQGHAPPGPKGRGRASKDAHVFVLGSAAMIDDDFLPQDDRVPIKDVAAQIALALNAIDWLAQEDALIAVRAKNVAEPQIEVPTSVRAAGTEARAAAAQGDRPAAEAALEKYKLASEALDQKRRMYRLLNIIVMPLLLVSFGLVRWKIRRRKRANLTL